MLESLPRRILLLVSSYPCSTRLCSSPTGASLKFNAETTLHGIPIVKASPLVCNDRGSIPATTLGVPQELVVAYLPENRMDAGSASAMLCHHLRPDLVIIAGPAVSFSQLVYAGDLIVGDAVYRRVELPMAVQGYFYEPNRALLNEASLVLRSLLSSQPVKQSYAATVLNRGQEQSRRHRPVVRQLPIVNLHPMASKPTRAVLIELASRYPNGWVADADSSSLAEVCGEAAIPWLAVRVAANNRRAELEDSLTEEVITDDAILTAGRLSERLAVALVAFYLNRRGESRSRAVHVHSPTTTRSLLTDVNGSVYAREPLLSDSVR